MVAAVAQRLKLVGVRMTSQSDLLQGYERDLKGVRQAVAGETIDYQWLPAPRSPVTPVFADDNGQQYQLQNTALGMVAVPFQAGPKLNLAEGQTSDGGFLSLNEIQSFGSNAPSMNDFPSPKQLQAAVANVLSTPSDSPDKPNPFDAMGKSLLQGLPSQILQQGGALFSDKGSLAGVLNSLSKETAVSLAGQIGVGIAQQAAGMLPTMALNSVWSVDGESSTGEFVAHQLAQDFMSQVASELVKAALTDATFSAIPASIAGNSLPVKIWNGFGKPTGPNNPALRVADKDMLGNVVTGPGSPTVVIEGLSAAREGDAVSPPGVKIYNGAKTVKISSLPAGRGMGGSLPPSESQAGYFVKAAARTFIGGPATGNFAPLLPPGGSGSSNGQKSASEAKPKEAKAKLGTDDKTKVVASDTQTSQTTAPKQDSDGALQTPAANTTTQQPRELGTGSVPLDDGRVDNVPGLGPTGFLADIIEHGIDSGPAGPAGCGSAGSGWVPDRIGLVDMTNACAQHDASPGWGTPGSLNDQLVSNAQLGANIIKDNPNFGGVFVGYFYTTVLDGVAVGEAVATAAGNIVDYVSGKIK